MMNISATKNTVEIRKLARTVTLKVETKQLRLVSRRTTKQHVQAGSSIAKTTYNMNVPNCTKNRIFGKKRNTHAPRVDKQPERILMPTWAKAFVIRPPRSATPWGPCAAAI